MATRTKPRVTLLGIATSLLLLPIFYQKAPAASLTPIYQFQGVNDGNGPEGNLTLGEDGVLYGVTAFGGNACPNPNPNFPGGICGTAFQLTPPDRPGEPWRETVLYNFKGGNDGSNPVSTLTLGEDGALYGTTGAGGGSGCSDLGASGCGTVFKLTPPRHRGESWTEEVIYSFQGAPGGAAPVSAVVFGEDGALYGTTSSGGDPNCYASSFQPPSGNATSCGTVFKLMPPQGPGGNWTETIIKTFHGGLDNGSPALADVFFRDGALFGVTNGCFFTPDFSVIVTCGSVFKLTPPEPPGGTWSYNVLYNFLCGDDGCGPEGGVIVKQGVVYGTAEFAGAGAGLGTIFALTRPATPGGMWIETTLHSFQGAPTDGALPVGNLLSGDHDILYGVTLYGGNGACSFGFGGGCGTVWQLAPTATFGGISTLAILQSFQGGSAGDQPGGGVILGEDGALYGTVFNGGTGNGYVFKLTGNGFVPGDDQGGD